MISVFDIFKIGIGPSSSHTVGPMRAAHDFVRSLSRSACVGRVRRLQVRLLGSLAWTGRGHGTDKAVVLGLLGQLPSSVDPARIDRMLTEVRNEKSIKICEAFRASFDPDLDIVFDVAREAKHHPNTLLFCALDGDGERVVEEAWCSIGGGFVCREDDIAQTSPSQPTGITAPFDFRSGEDLLKFGLERKLSIAEMVMANECSIRSKEEVEYHLDQITAAMMGCIDRGLSIEGELPGGLKVKRRAKSIFDQLEASARSNMRSPHEVMDWVSLYAIAVNEENAAGGRVVTAPTNGAAGVVPATLRYYRDHCPTSSADGMRTFLLTAAAIGALFKMNASISGAEVGCQGEVGVACSMAAAGLAAVLGGDNAQIENAAEIGMEHHLGMTCDPVGGLVQVPCIERNAFGAVSAVNAASLALRGDGRHIVSLDVVIRTMRDTGRDMQSKYKETSLGGLAVNLPEC
ncbi:L-serine ammonia-lyase [Bradyrhizobium sp. CCBAU 53421]|uniref:L-serine ammonia-lyase n=1 Tax=Bradyrhizobium sp. CCBAU 53421 TaxID=1325120 RepID=UPI00188D78C4|nr:L-serine ammonia-lyase [Bradyrhizobium sp. CCBAU 53421]QOZ36523.1 L-serine ammonia-lyase [Bradyrhizobium sp. CCBAU 53421]